jgi:WXXGXW repeat (2 copies)
MHLNLVKQERPMRCIYNHRFRLPSLAAIASIGLAVSASAQNSTVIIAPSAPPPPRVETVPPPPPANTQTMTWQAGHWAWNGSNWNWDDGHCVQAPQSQAVWEPGHWELQASGGYVWVEGRWRS